MIDRRDDLQLGSRGRGRRAADRLAEDQFELFFVDGQEVVRDGLRALVERQPDFVVVGSSPSAASGAAYDGAPDVVVADIDLPDAKGREAIELLRRYFPASALFVLTDVDHPVRVRQALTAGVDGYLSKSASPSELFFGLRTVARGETYLHPALELEAAGLAAGLSTTMVYMDRLTEKESVVLRLLARGFTSREIADHRHVSVRTVEAQRARIVDKTGMRLRSELVRYAHTLGIDGLPA